MNTEDKKISRKNFLKKIGRYSLMAGLSGLCGKLIIQSKFEKKTKADVNCNFICYNCRQISNCEINKNKKG